MKKAISDNYVQTADALLVEKYLGGEIADTFIGGLTVENYKEEILQEAKRRDEEANKEKEKRA